MKDNANVFWDIVEGDKSDIRSDWDELLLKAADCNIFQTYAWGEYKRIHGWEPVRCIGRDKSGRVVGLAQILIKQQPFGICIGWAPGGPVIQFGKWTHKIIGDALDTLFIALTHKYKKLWLRFHSHLNSDPELAFVFSGRLHRPFFKVNSEFTEHIGLARTEDEIESAMTSKHRYYVRKSQAHEIEWKFGNDQNLVADFTRLHAEMTKEKAMESIRLEPQEIHQLVSLMEGRVLVFNGYYAGAAVSSCLVFILGNKAFYAYAATGKEGRELSATYAMIPQLLYHLKSKGVELFDFAGLDPKNPSAFGVNHFKRGFGGRLVETLGEWEWATSEKLRILANLAIWRKGGRL